MGKIFKKRPYKSLEIGGKAFIADFYVDNKKADAEHNYLHIHTPNNVFEQKVVGYPYVYLLAAVEQGKEEEVHGYCALLWRVTQEIYQDAGLANDILRAFNKHDKRLMKKAEEAAKSVTPEQETADQAFMESVAEYAAATPKRRKEISRADRELLREVLNDNKEGGHG